MRRTLTVITALVALLVVDRPGWCAPAAADAPADAPADVTGDAAVEPDVVADRSDGTPFGSLFYLEHHGYFRFRSDLFWQADLGIRGVSGVAPPLLENRGNEGFEGGQKGNHVLGGANIRFRYAPELHIGERVRVYTWLDVLDNFVLGSTPASGPAGYGVWAFGLDSAVPPTSDVNGVSDAIVAKALWGELLLFDAITIRLGRIPDEWGLGVVRHPGRGIDDDYGAAVDRADFMGSWGGFHFGFTYDFFVEGVTTEDRYEPYGQEYGLDTADDVGQWILYLEQRPRRPEELEKRQRDLYVAGRPVFDWGFMSAFRTQDATSARQERATPLEDACLTGPDATSDIAYDCLQMVPRDAFLWTPDFWGRLLWVPRPGHLLRVELEVALTYGNISVTEFLRNTDTSKDILQAGGVLQAQYDIGATSFGFEFGFATGDDTDGVFGISDGSEIVDTDSPSPQSFQIRNRTLTNFKFSRGYHIDHILYREVIGAITNSWYLHPWVSHSFWQKGVQSFGARLDLLYARAFDADGTPGRAFDLGFEIDAMAYYRIGKTFEARFVFASLIPMGGLDHAAYGLDAEPAITTQLNLFWMF